MKSPKLFFATIISIFLISGPLVAQPAHAAQFFADQMVDLAGDQPHTNVYAAGRSINISSPITDDATLAGNDISVHSTIDGNLNAAGQNITIDGTVNHSARLAGSQITINGHIKQDVVVFGADVLVASKAAIDGDLIVFGASATINGTVTGQVTANGGTITVNSSIGSLYGPHVNNLILGSHADIKGNLNYTSPTMVQQNKGAIVQGTTAYHQAEPSNPFKTAGFFYSIFASILFGLVLLYLFPYFPAASRKLLKTSPWRTLGIGALILVFAPLVALLISFFSPWLGIALGLIYALCLIISYPLSQILLGGWLLDWWYGRNHQAYDLDWRAIIIGTIAFVLMSLVPIIGWLIVAIVFLIALGSLFFDLKNFSQYQQVS